MSVTLHLRGPCGDTHSLDADGSTTILGLYNLVSKAAGVADGTFELHYEGEVLNRWVEGLTVEGSGLCEGCEVSIVHKDPLRVHVSEMGDEQVMGRAREALVEDPEGTLVVDVSGVAGELSIAGIPANVKNVAVVCPGGAKVTRLGDGFLQRSMLRKLDLRALTDIVEIGKNFMFHCSALTSMLMSPLLGAEVDDGFLCYCRSLQSVDLAPLSNVTKIADNFLNFCESLHTIDLSPLSNVTEIGDSFLGGCANLREVDLTGLRNVTAIDGKFLSRSGVTSIDLSPLKSITSLGQGALRGCSYLRSIDLSSLGNLTKISHSFLSGTALVSVDLSPLKNVTEIGILALSQCFALQSINLRGLGNVHTIGAGFLYYDKSLQTVDLSPLKNLHTVGRQFLCQTGLAAVDLRPLTEVTKVEGLILEGCSDLTMVKLRKGSTFENYVKRLRCVQIE
eukprot:TRINITY_DN3377_c3_g1_i1.p1 TRINITY_DN3377_c3_g1~~TRINITY_DN3377_c3_g1_i1.p1  ORF type:complete len:450 (+),score=79.26 TRINITY_DN3377_c3_g1_i1:717-2066(+)